MKAKTELAISRYQNSNGHDGIHIEVSDNVSRIRFLSMDLTLEQFAEAVTGLYVTDIETEYHGLDLIGTTAENKTESIPVTDFSFGDKILQSSLEAKVKAIEIDGWHRRLGDEMNSHNYHTNKKTGAKTVGIVFFRHVKPDGTAVER